MMYNSKIKHCMAFHVASTERQRRREEATANLLRAIAYNNRRIRAGLAPLLISETIIDATR